MLKLSKKQFDTLDVTAVCANCEHASPLMKDGDLLCRFYGVVAEDHSCRKFRCDLLKYRPSSRISLGEKNPLPTLDDEDENTK